MRRICLVLALLACVGHGRQEHKLMLDPWSSRFTDSQKLLAAFDEVHSHRRVPTSPKRALCQLKILTRLLLASNAGTAFNPAAPVVRSVVGNRNLPLVHSAILNKQDSRGQSTLTKAKINHGRSAGIAMASKMSSSHLEQLQTQGFTVVPDFLSPEQVAELKDDVATLKKEQRFSVAGIVQTTTEQAALEIRNCEQSFIYPRDKYQSGGNAEARRHLYETLEGLMENIKESTGVELSGFLTEGLYVAYPSGGYYRRHIDSKANTPQEFRKFSYLIYCNDEWQSSDGGLLRIHTDGGGELAPPGAAPSFVDVEPRAGTLVVFRSDMPHEVLDTSAPRLAVAGWFNAAPEGSSTRRTIIAALAGAITVKLGIGALQGGGNDQKTNTP